MNKKILLLVSAIAVVIIAGLILTNRGKEDTNSSNGNESLSSALSAVTSNEGGVEVIVTPINISKGSPEWSFGVSLTTHAGDLSENMVEVSELTFGSGEILRPAKWEGSPPGGHHRSGVLKFFGNSKIASGITLKIKNVGGVPEREFTWNLK